MSQYQTYKIGTTPLFTWQWTVAPPGPHYFCRVLPKAVEATRVEGVDRP
jgi:hypothetical protein